MLVVPLMIPEVFINFKERVISGMCSVLYSTLKTYK